MTVNELDSILEKKCPQVYEVAHQLNEIQFQFQILYGKLLEYLFSFAKEEEEEKCN